jgi:hypothetical protein
MIIYQLPNGKIVHLTVDQFLSLQDDDIKYMIENNFGSDVHNPFSIKTSKQDDDYDYDIEDDIYPDDDNEPSEPFDINNIFED